VEGKARIAQQVERLHRPPHRTEPKLAILHIALDAADPRRPISSQRRESLVLACIEALANAPGEFGHLALELAPTRHGRQPTGDPARNVVDAEAERFSKAESSRRARRGKSLTELADGRVMLRRA
jgi:hypothetical protein